MSLRRRRLTVKFDVTPADQLPYEAGPALNARLAQLAGADLLAFTAMYPGAIFAPLVPSMKPSVIDALVAAAGSHGIPPVNFFAYYMVTVPPGADPDRMLSDLRAWSLVESAHIDPGPSRPAAAVHPENDPEVINQMYLGSAPMGIDAAQAWARDGGDGENQVVAVVEGDWFVHHPDLPTEKIEVITGIVAEYDKLGPGDIPQIERSHGTMTLGVLAARDDDFGCIGIAPGVKTIGVSGTWRPCSDPAPIEGRVCEDWDGASVWSHPEEAVYQAVEWLKTTKPEGSGVLLIEVHDDLHDFDPRIAKYTMVPLECRSYVHALITAAVAWGLIVVEVAGNGSLHLVEDIKFPNIDIPAGGGPPDPIEVGLPVGLVNPAAPAHDSGAIMVGAGLAPVHQPVGHALVELLAPGDPWDFPRSGVTNYGARIDCFAWGNNVRSTTHQLKTLASLGLEGAGLSPVEAEAALKTGMSDFEYYTGTSSASAIVAGLVLALLGVYEKCMSTPTDIKTLDPGTVRDILRDAAKGSPSTYQKLVAGAMVPVPDDDPADLQNLIRFMPDLQKIIEGDEFAACTFAADVYVRDEISDKGDPRTGVNCKSPDIISRASFKTQAQAQAEWGQGSGKEDSEDLSFSVLKGIDHNLWVRVRNRGNKDADAVRAKVFYTPASTLTVPTDWTEIGAIDMGRVCHGEELTLSPPIPWSGTAIPETGDYCFVAILDTEGDAAPDRLAIKTIDDYLAFVNDNNNVAWLNFKIIYFEPDMMVSPKLEFTIPGGFGSSTEFEVELDTNKPADVGLSLLLPARLNNLLNVSGGIPVDMGRMASVDLTTAVGRTRLGVGMFPPEPISLAVDPVGKAARAERPRLTLRTRIPSQTSRVPFDVTVRQLYEGQSVGSFTWRFIPRRGSGLLGKVPQDLDLRPGGG